MRNIVYKDLKIPQAEYEQVIADYIAFLKKYAGLAPVFWTVPHDFSDYPTFVDTDGDSVIRPAFLQDLADKVTAHYGKDAVDNIITLIHEDNWKSGKTATTKGIWGTNYSYRFGNYHVQYCRWDKDNQTNTFGTLNHEQDHTYDALIKVELGIDINPILGLQNYDLQSTHGSKNSALPAYHAYIRHKENADKLKVLAPYLQSAYQKRLNRHTEALRGRVVGLQKTIISLLEKLIYQLKMKQNQKNGNPK